MMKKASFLLLLVCAASCRTQKPSLQPVSGPLFRSLIVKFQFQGEGERQNGRVHWRFDENASKFLFFTPLNQAGLELDVAGEEAVLVNFAKKSFWRGNFSYLLERLWGIGVALADLKSLLLTGEIPEGGFAEKGIEAIVEDALDGGRLRAVRLRRGKAELALRILKNESRPGKVILIDYSGRYRAADLESVLEG